MRNDKEHVSRRDFNRLTMAAFGGLMAGAVSGCGGQQNEQPPGEAPPAEQTGEGAAMETPVEATETAMADVNLLLEEPHVCRGLNTCKGQGAGGENECAGQGNCATVEHHFCSGQNACKGQGGCGEHPGQNACKGQGHCAVPLMDEAWEKARAAFEQAMAAQGKSVGEAPPKS